MKTNKVPLSVLIPVRNAAVNLPRCLASVAWADEIFVVASHSTDASVAIARAAGAHVAHFAFNGVWPKKKNWALTNLPFRHEWVLVLDADEAMPAAAAGEIATVLELDGAGRAGYWIDRRYLFRGGWLRHSSEPNRSLRLFKHALGRYEKLAHDSAHDHDDEIHEHLHVDGDTGLLRCALDHRALPLITAFATPHVSRQGSPRPRLSPVRKALHFLLLYVARRGFLDGARGFEFARLRALRHLPVPMLGGAPRQGATAVIGAGNSRAS